MTENELRARIKQAADNKLSGLKDDPWLAARVLDESERKMKKKLYLVPMIAILILAISCGVALAAGALKMPDFLSKYTYRSIPSDVGTLVQNCDISINSARVKANVSEALYDGRSVRLMMDILPVEEHTMLIGPDTWPDDKAADTTAYDLFRKGCFEKMYNISIYPEDDEIGVADPYDVSSDWTINSDGSISYLIELIYPDHADEQKIKLQLVICTVTNPETDDYYHIEMSTRECSTVSLDIRSNCDTKTYICDTPADYPSAGVRIERITLEASPLEIYYTITYTVYGEKSEDILFEFIDPDITAVEPWLECLPGGMGVGTMSMMIDGNTRIEMGGLAFDQLREEYVIRAFDPYTDGKNRYESNSFTFKPE